jgi:hypothetical protein
MLLVRPCAREIFLKAVSRGIPLATALQNGWRGVPKPSVPAAASWSAVASGIPRDTAFPGFAPKADPRNGVE